MHLFTCNPGHKCILLQHYGQTDASKPFNFVRPHFTVSAPYFYKTFFIAVVYADRLSATNLHLLTFKETYYGTMIKKSPHLFLLYLESMYYRYLPCLILSYDFDEKSDFLNYEFSKRLPAITQFKNGLVQKRELGRGRM